MQLFRDMSVGAKLYSAFGAVVALLCVCVVVALSSLSTLHAKSNSIGLNALPSVVAVDTINLDEATYRRTQLALLAFHAPAAQQAYEATLATTVGKLRVAFAAYGRLADGSGDVTAWHQAAASWQQYLTSSATAQPLIKAGRFTAATTALDGPNRLMFLAIGKQGAAWSALNAALAGRSVKSAGSAYTSARMQLLAVALVAVLAAMAVAFLLSRSIKRSVDLILERLTSLRDNCMAYVREGMDAFAAGDLTKRYAPVT
jgi:methyl-accepting chemotaxis protein